MKEKGIGDNIVDLLNLVRDNHKATKAIKEYVEELKAEEPPEEVIPDA